jgi:hypothetical protein
MRNRVEAIERDGLFQPAFRPETLQEREMPRRYAAVAAKELRGGREPPETLEIEGTAADEVLNRLVHLFVGPLEGEGTRSERHGKRVHDSGRLVHAMWLADDDETRLGHCRSRGVDRVAVEHKRVEPILADSGPKVTRRRHDHETRLAAAN